MLGWEVDVSYITVGTFLVYQIIWRKRKPEQKDTNFFFFIIIFFGGKKLTFFIIQIKIYFYPLKRWN